MTVSSMEQQIVAWNYGNDFKGKLKASEKLFEDKHSYRIWLLFSRFSFILLLHLCS